MIKRLKQYELDVQLIQRRSELQPLLGKPLFLKT